MSTSAPSRVQQSYRHEAFLWYGPDDFVRGLLPFVHEGLDAGEAVMVATVPAHISWLASGLGARAAEVHFVDMSVLGRNPARIIPAWLRFLQAHAGIGRPARGIGEPIWPGRRPEEVAECQLHEGLLNLAVDPQLPFWLVCPYDADVLDDDVVAEAYRSHPAIATTNSYAGSRTYRGRDHARALFSAELPDPAGQPTTVTVSPRGLTAAAEQVTLRAAAADLGSHQVVALADAVRRLAVQSRHRGADQIRLRLWDDVDGFVCELADRTVIPDLLVGRHLPQEGDTDPLWCAHQVCDLVQVRSAEGGTTIRLHLRPERPADGPRASHRTTVSPAH